MFKLQSLKGRLILLVLVSLCGLLVLTACQIANYRGQVREDRVQTLRAAVAVVTTTVKTLQAMAARAHGGVTPSLWPRPGSETPVPKLLLADYVEGWGWVVGSGLYSDDLDALLLRQIGSTAALIGVIAWAMARSVLARIGGEPALAMEKMRRVAEGDVSVGLDGAPAGSLLGELHRLVGTLAGTLREIVADAGEVDRAAEDISRTSREVANSAGAETDSVQGMAAAMEELTVSIDHVAGNAAETESKAESAAALAQQVERVAQQIELTSQNMHVTADASEALRRIAHRLKDAAGAFRV